MIAAKDDTIRDVKIMSKSNPMYTFRFAEKFNGNYSILKYQLILPFNLHHIGKLPAWLEATL